MDQIVKHYVGAVIALVVGAALIALVIAWTAQGGSVDSAFNGLFTTISNKMSTCLLYTSDAADEL